MSAEASSRFAEELRRHIPIIDDVRDLGADGLRAIKLTGRELRQSPISDLVATIREALGSKVRVYAPEGTVLRMMPYSDCYLLCLASPEWPVVPDGCDIPEMRIAHWGAVAGFYPDGPSTRIYPLPDFKLEIPMDKRTHQIEINAETETEDQVLIVIRPRNKQAGE